MTYISGLLPVQMCHGRCLFCSHINTLLLFIFLQMVGMVIGAGIVIVLIAILIFFILRRIQLRSKLLMRCIVAAASYSLYVFLGQLADLSFLIFQT